MERVYKKFKGVEIVYPKYKGVLCGYSENNFILAIEQKVDCSFRKVAKDILIEDEYRDVKYRYVFCDETELITQHPNLK